MVASAKCQTVIAGICCASRLQAARMLLAGAPVHSNRQHAWAAWSLTTKLVSSKSAAPARRLRFAMPRRAARWVQMGHERLQAPPMLCPRHWRLECAIERRRMRQYAIPRDTQRLWSALRPACATLTSSIEQLPQCNVPSAQPLYLQFSRCTRVVLGLERSAGRHKLCWRFVKAAFRPGGWYLAGPGASPA